MSKRPKSFINGAEAEPVTSFKFLCVHLSEDLVPGHLLSD